MPRENGETRRQYNARFDEPSPEVDPQDRSPEGDRLLQVFWRLCRFRTQGFNGPDPLQPGLIRDWIVTAGWPLSQPEIEIVFQMDAAYLAACQRETQPKEGG